MRSLPPGRQFLSETLMATMPAVLQLQQAGAVIVAVMVVVVMTTTAITLPASARRQPLARCFALQAPCSVAACIPAPLGWGGGRALGGTGASDFHPVCATGPEFPKGCQGRPSCPHRGQSPACARGCVRAWAGADGCGALCVPAWAQPPGVPVAAGPAAASATSKRALPARRPPPTSPPPPPLPRAGGWPRDPGVCPCAVPPGVGRLWVCVPGVTAPAVCCASASEHPPVSAGPCHRAVCLSGLTLRECGSCARGGTAQPAPLLSLVPPATSAGCVCEPGSVTLCARTWMLPSLLRTNHPEHL